MIYFIHDAVSQSIKIGHALNTRDRMSQLQTSRPNELVLLGEIAGTRRTEKRIHALVLRHHFPKPGDPPQRSLIVNGEWFDDRIRPFVDELMADPARFLRPERKGAFVRPPRATGDPSLYKGKAVLVFDTGETFAEWFVLQAPSPAHALGALGNIVAARLGFLASTARVTKLVVPGCPAKAVDLRGAFVTQRCDPRVGLAAYFNSRPESAFETRDSTRQYSHGWLHGIPSELYTVVNPWLTQVTDQCRALLLRFTQALSANKCVIVAQVPLVVRGVFPRDVVPLPKGKLRSRTNKAAAARQKPARPRGPAAPKTGYVYFLQDPMTLSIKIGFSSKDPAKRRAGLQIGSANTLRPLGHVAGTDADEKALHARLARFRLRGEWFSSAVLPDVEAILKCRSVGEWMKVQNPDPLQPRAPVGDAGAPEDPDLPPSVPVTQPLTDPAP